MTRGFTAPPLMFESFKATRRLKQMEERMDDFERTMKRIQLEWEETYDKMRLIMQRVAKRAIQIERIGNQGEALRAWRELFGPLFPLS